MRLAAAALAAVLLAGCGGGDEYAGLSREDAESRLDQVVRAAERDGTAARELAQLSSAGDEAMSRAGGADLGRIVVAEKGTVSRGAMPTGGDAWVGEYTLAGVGSAAALCAYVADGNSAVDVRADC